MHPIAVGNVPANEYIPGVTEIAGHSTNASPTLLTRALDKYKTSISLKIYIKNIRWRMNKTVGVRWTRQRMEGSKCSGEPRPSSTFASV